MQILLRAAQNQLHADDPAQSIRDRGQTGAELRGVRDHDDIGAKSFALLADERDQARAADFLLSLDEDLDRHVLPDARFQSGPDPADQGEALALVVGGTARDHVAGAEDRLEGLAVPAVPSGGRLDVVVAVDEYGRPAGPAGSLAVDDGEAVGRDDLGAQARRVHMRPHEIPGLSHGVSPGGIAAHARDAQQLEQFLAVLFPPRGDDRSSLLEIGAHGLLAWVFRVFVS